MATCAGSPQTAVRAHGSNKCTRHQGKEVVYYCTNCSNLACGDCVIQECQGHLLEGISNVVPTFKQSLQDFITKAEQTEIPSIKSKLHAANNDLDKTKDHFKNEIRKIRKQNEAVKKALDNITDTFVKTYQGFEQQNTDELLNYMRGLQSRIDKLSYQIQDVKGALQSGNDILVCDMSQVIQSKIRDLSKPVYSRPTPEFTPGIFSVQVLEQSLGELYTTVHPQSLNEPFVMRKEFTPSTEHIVMSMHAAAEKDQVWLRYIDTNTMLLLTDKGQVKQTLDMAVPVQDFCFSPLCGNIWFISVQDKSVREVIRGQSIVRFTTDTPPRCICVDKDGYVVIGFRGEVVKYTQGGQKICSTSGGTPPVVRTPLHLSKCPLTSNLALVDDNKKEDGGNSKPFVSILDDQLKPLYTYNGERQENTSLTRKFDPADVFFTGIGELVITDWNNGAVVLLTGTGRYQRTLWTNSDSSPYAVCVHNNWIWVSFGDKSVKVFKENGIF